MHANQTCTSKLLQWNDSVTGKHPSSHPSFMGKMGLLTFIDLEIGYYWPMQARSWICEVHSSALINFIRPGPVSQFEPMVLWGLKSNFLLTFWVFLAEITIKLTWYRLTGKSIKSVLQMYMQACHTNRRHEDMLGNWGLYVKMELKRKTGAVFWDFKGLEGNSHRDEDQMFAGLPSTMGHR